MSDPQWPVPRKEADPAPPPSAAVDSAASWPAAEGPGPRLAAVIGFARTAVGLVIGAAITGAEALMAEVTTRRGTASDRH